MDLILWRHADAEDGYPDLERKLTTKGRQQAEQVAAWLKQRLPAKYSLLASPAARAQQTAAALGARIETVPGLAPGASPRTIVAESGWPDRDGTVIVVGHQPDLGRAAAQLVSGAAGAWNLEKGALWWLSSRTLEDERHAVVQAVVSPDLL